MDFGPGEVDGMLKPELGEVWTALKTAVSAGGYRELKNTTKQKEKQTLKKLP